MLHQEAAPATLVLLPTSRPRISVTKDQSLTDALQRGRRLLTSDAPEATLLRDLAIQGARLLAAEDVRRERSLRDLADHDWLDERFESDALGRADENRLPVAL